MGSGRNSEIRTLNDRTPQIRKSTFRNHHHGRRTSGRGILQVFHKDLSLETVVDMIYNQVSASE